MVHLVVPSVAILAHLTFGAVQYPSFTNVIPCVNTPENCGKNYYNIQQNLQGDLGELYNSAADAQASAGALLNQVKDPTTGLKTIADQLTDLIDPDNTKTNGGSYMNLPNKTTIRGVTPYMYTLSQRLINSVASRGSDLRAAANSLKSGMDSLTKQMLDTQTSANTLISQISGSVPTQITQQSSQIRDFLTSVDLKMSGDSSNFNSQASSAPGATLSGLQSALALESTDANTTLAKLQQIQTDVTNQPADLDNYITGLMTDLQSYRSQQESAGDALAVQKTTEFTRQLVGMTSTLSAALQGILTTDKSSPYYNTSLPGYIGQQRASLDSQIQSANSTQQNIVTSLSSQVQNLMKNVNSAFQPILATVNSQVAQLVSADQVFQDKADGVITDARATVSKANTSFNTFSTNLGGAWNLTEGILTGQITNISASLLNLIGSMTSQAGAEVAKLDDIMNSLAAQSLASDAVRQTILSDSRNQVISYIGSNEAAMNASFSTIFRFLNDSQSQLALISSVLSTLTTQGQAQLNQSAQTVISGIQNQISLTNNGTYQILTDLVNNVSANIANDQASVNLLYDALVNASVAQIDQTNALLQGMQNATDTAVSSTMISVNNVTNVINTAASLAASLLNTVNTLPAVAQQMQTNQTTLTSSIVADANGNLTAIQSAIKNKFLAVQTQIQQAGSLLSSNQTGLLQNLSSTLTSASSAFDSSIAQMLTLFNSNLTQLQTNASISQTQVTDMTNKLNDASAAVDKAYSTGAALLTADSDVTPVQVAVKSYTANVKTAVMNALNANLTLAQSDVGSRVTALQSLMTQMEAQIGSLTQITTSLKSSPQELVNKAQQLQSQYATQLGQLKADILSFSQKNDRQSSLFSQAANKTFGNETTMDGKMALGKLLNGLQTTLSGQITQANQSVSGMRATYAQMIATGGTELQTSANQFLATIASHRAALNTTTTDIVNGVYKHMNTSYSSLQTNVTKSNQTLFAGYNANQLLQGRLTDLSSQVSQTVTQVQNMNDSTVMSNLISQYGANATAQIQALLAQSNASLSAAQQAELNRQILVANQALGAAGGFNSSGSSLSSAVQTALAAVTSTQGQLQANTNLVKQKLQAVVAASNSTTSLTAADVAAIIQQFSSSSSATQTAIQAQLNASSSATHQVGYAMGLWDSLRKQAMNLTDDMMKDLVETRNDVAAHVDNNVTEVTNIVGQNVSSLQQTADRINTVMGLTHQQDMDFLDQIASNLETVASSAVAEKSNYDRSVSGLRGYVANIVAQLNSRYNSIVNQVPEFRVALESAAAQDIAGISR